MIETHSYFEELHDGTSIWRYMDLAKYLDMIRLKRVHFSRLSIMKDKYEMEIHWLSYRRINPQRRDDYIQRQLMKKNSIGINCWTMDDVENEALWRKYVNGRNRGVAIQTTIGKLKSAFSKVHRPVYIGEIKYREPSENDFDSEGWYLAMMKRSFYQYENELRLVTRYNPDDITESMPEDGLDLHVDMNELISSIYIHPESSVWFSKLVNFTTKDAIDVHKPICQSEIRLSF